MEVFMGYTRKNKGTITEDELNQIFDDIDNGIIPEITYIPTQEELEQCNIKENFRKYAPYLVKLSESTSNQNLTEQEKEQLHDLNPIIDELIATQVIYKQK